MTHIFLNLKYDIFPVRPIKFSKKEVMTCVCIEFMPKDTVIAKQ